MSTLIRISTKAHKKLKQKSANSGATIMTIVDLALDALYGVKRKDKKDENVCSTCGFAHG